MRFLRNTLYLILFTIIGNVSLFAQDLSLIYGDYSGAMGDTICVDLTVANFTGVSSMEWKTRFDPAILRFLDLDLTQSALNVNGDNLLSSGDFNLLEGLEGTVTIVWANGPPEGLMLDNGDIIYTLCFEIIGEPCESSILAIAPNQNTITITITDSNTGSENDLPESEIDIVFGSVTVDPAGFLISESHCSSDDNNNTGSITFAGSGGNGPYSWELQGTGQSGVDLNDCETATVDNLAPGSYTLALTDSDNVTRVEIITISASSAFPYVLTLDGINPTCFDKDNGSVFIDNIVGGEGNFTYEWSNQNFVDDSIEDLETGDYSLTITDENGCSTSADYSLAADTVKVNLTVVSDPSCDGSADGIVSFTASGGTPFVTNGYTYDVDGVSPTFFIGNGVNIEGPFSPANFFEGCFSVKVIDSLGCQSDTTQFCLEAGSFSTLTIDTTDVSCFGLCDGSVTINAGITGNYAFQVTDPAGASLLGANTATTYQASNLCPGTYMATVTDNSDGCFIDTMFIVGEPLLLEMTIDSTGPGCGGGDGMVTLGANGGTMPYSFLWEDGFDQPVRSNMPGGNYSVTVTDLSGCQDSIMWTFADGGDIGLSAGVQNAVNCESSADGVIVASVSVSGDFTFSWEDSNGLSLGDGAVITGLSGGIYNVTATDGMCTDTATVILAPGQTPSATVDMMPPLCPYSNNGMLTATLLDGVAPAMFEWTIPPSTAIISAGAVVTGAVGMYNLHITDMNGCESDQLFEILPPDNPIQVTISNLTENFCFGSCSAAATFTASGGPAGTGDYTFSINGNSSVAIGGSFTATDLCAGPNFVTALDGQCFSDTLFFDVDDVSEIMIDVANSVITSPSCNGDSDGSISAVVIGGNSSNYDLLWLNEGVTGSDLSNLTAGEYVLQITDGSGCIYNDTIDLTEPDLFTVVIDPSLTTDISCVAGATGTIGLATFGGNVGDLTYNWSPDVSSTSIANNLNSGIYEVTVSDINGCSDSTSYELTSAPPIIATIPVPDEPACFGGSTCIRVASVTGGTGSDYSFSINFGPQLPIDTCVSVFAGENIRITIFDGQGAACAVDTFITIDQPSQVTVDVGEDITIDLGSSSDPISAFIVSEFDIDSIVWTPEIDIECNTSDCQIVTFSPSETTSYTITVTDENGCLATDDIEVLVDLTRHVYTPNIFSPNLDNVNDHFQLVTGNGVTMVNYLKIYDRWGSLVYEDESYMPNDTEHIGWDGTRNGTNNEPGVYVFFAEVEFIDGVSVVYKGDVTLVR